MFVCKSIVKLKNYFNFLSLFTMQKYIPPTTKQNKNVEKQNRYEMKIDRERDRDRE